MSERQGKIAQAPPTQRSSCSNAKGRVSGGVLLRARCLRRRDQRTHLIRHLDGCGRRRLGVAGSPKQGIFKSV